MKYKYTPSFASVLDIYTQLFKKVEMKSDKHVVFNKIKYFLSGLYSRYHFLRLLGFLLDFFEAQLGQNHSSSSGGSLVMPTHGQ